MFDSAAQMVVIEGQEGTGKTTLAAQFARKNQDRAISLFISDVSAFSRSPEYLLSILCDQISWYFDAKRMSADANFEIFIRTARFRLQREAIANNRPFYFVIDGLLQVADVDPGLVSLILTDYLSVGIPGFKFLLTGDVSKVPRVLRDKIQYKPWTPPGFSPAETKTLLDEFHLSSGVLLDIGNAFGGIPGKIASIRRSLQSGLSASALESGLPHSLPDLFAIEWGNVDCTNDLQVAVLAALAHARHQLTTDALSDILETDASAVLESVKKLRFIQQSSDGKQLSYASNSFKEFAASELASH